MDELALKVGRLEDKLELYEPIFKSLPGLVSLPTELDQINRDLRTLKDSRIEVREKLTTLFKTQTRAYDEIVKKLEEKARIQEKEIEECPIKDAMSRLTIVERDTGVLESFDKRSKDAEDVFDRRLKIVEKSIDSFKVKGWDLLFRIGPWVIAGGSILWATLIK